LARFLSLQNKGRTLIHAQFAHYGPQSGHSRANTSNREKSQDCVAGGEQDSNPQVPFTAEIIDFWPENRDRFLSLWVQRKSRRNRGAEAWVRHAA